MVVNEHCAESPLKEPRLGVVQRTLGTLFPFMAVVRPPATRGFTFIHHIGGDVALIQLQTWHVIGAVVVMPFEVIVITPIASVAFVQSDFPSNLCVFRSGCAMRFELLGCSCGGGIRLGLWYVGIDALTRT